MREREKRAVFCFRAANQYRGYSKRRTLPALGPYGRSIPRNIGSSQGRCVSLNSSNPCIWEPGPGRRGSVARAGLPHESIPAKRFMSQLLDYADKHAKSQHVTARSEGCYVTNFWLLAGFLGDNLIIDLWICSHGKSRVVHLIIAEMMTEVILRGIVSPEARTG